MLLNCGVGEDSWESLGQQGDQTSQSWRESILNSHWRDWCWGWSSNILATWCKELTHWKRLWCWKRLKAGGEGDDRGHDMVGWHHQLHWHEFEQAPGDGEGQGSLVCCSPWGCKESDMIYRLNNNNLQSISKIQPFSISPLLPLFFKPLSSFAWITLLGLLLAGLPASVLDPLQSILNIASRMI